ncbi:MAG: hypothetical protein ACXVSX_13070 [Solirubrobacteraceae bacterium]
MTAVLIGVAAVWLGALAFCLALARAAAAGDRPGVTLPPPRSRAGAASPRSADTPSRRARRRGLAGARSRSECSTA